MRLTPKLTNKWKLLLLLLLSAGTVVLINLRFFDVARRPKTLLIYNNEHLCTSHASDLLLPKQPLTSPNPIAQTSIVIVIPSFQQNFLQRNLIRQTYGSVRNVNNVKILAVVFVLGWRLNPGRNAHDDIFKLEAERDQFGDIIMGDLTDTYRNLSRKSVMAYDWLVSFCQEADFVVKTDDDVFVDVFKLTAELSRWTPDVAKSFNFWCAVHSMETVDRNKKSIYYISPDEYPGKKIPKHCAGVGYVTQMGVVRLIAEEISKSFLGPICSHEDVFMTGIVPERLNSKRSEPIKHVNKMLEWVFYVDENNPNKDGKYIWDVISDPKYKSVSFDEFRKRSGTRIFYLLQHDPNFKKKFLRLWYFIKNSFQNEATSNILNKVGQRKA
ncbi:Beta-1,3-galactosyltransferase 1 [Pseudolycoriella hygida]|uniref:Hexosyltransferase n=1 Tax=Pseudolycoriella hygida TaxID=35572 RepID=A0A9Q0MRQ4_9DIPT|nr:Beta-1,3-galactosyltransferase 1 [Pseudolycoriella hygida]